MPLENWVHHSALWPFLYDWQTLLAGIFALGAAVLTVLGTFTSANRQIDAANKQAEKVIAASREAADRESCRQSRPDRHGAKADRGKPSVGATAPRKRRLRVSRHGGRLYGARTC